MTATADTIWDHVDSLIDRARTLDDLREHRLELLAARRWRELGRPVPRDVVEEERLAAINTLSVPLLLERIRACLDCPVVLFKGPEVAARYPDPALRPYGDLDLLVQDARVAHRALVRAGFIEVGDPALYVDIHHLRPLRLDPIPLLVEIHAAPKWIDSLTPPPTADLIASAIPSRVGGEEILTLRPDHHVLILAAHSWAHEPLRRILELVDIAAMTQGLDRDRIHTLAQEWQLKRVWETTLAAADAMLAAGQSNRGPVPFRLWARNVPAVRRRTVFESHLERWLAEFWALPPRKALPAAALSAVHMFTPQEGERWREKFARMRLAFRDASAPRSQHDQALGSRRHDPRSGGDA